ncbi:hypothetical protein [Natranaerofaba carboxydovora]|uniref:hypothetical protein n=1 Tax=Natranaerofaba carboxydovora TaxID=2742683 RepID=UPI001F1408F4|nr:hypothetical protein [Natranaerofaba carboxydovora]UMZ73033.1 hypothetical protein ACONDI_00579 [Natranaerofaba carboxydovora]
MRTRLTFLTVVLAIFMLVTVGCGEQEEELDISQEEKNEIVAVIERNLEATEDEDIDAFSETMYQNHPDFEIAVEETKQLFEQFDLEYELEILDVSLADEETATVEFEQETRAENGEDFEDNTATGVHEVRIEDGQWKIYETEITDSQPLE